MADAERMLLAKAINAECMDELLEAKISDRYFIDEEHIRVWEWMQEHFRTYGVSPSYGALKDNYPTWKCPDTPETLDYYVDRVRLRFRYDVLQEALAEATDLVADDVSNTDRAEKLLIASLNEIAAVATPLKDHNLTDPDAFDRLYDHYEELTKNPGALRGLSTGWPTIDLACMGLQGGQLVTFVGPPKGGKSTVMLSAADECNLDGNKVLFISFEMSYDEMVARWVGKRAGLNYRRLLKGKMSDLDRKRMNRLLKQLEKDNVEDFILSEDISSTTTVSGIIAKIQLHKPKVLFIDGVYLMDDENGEPKGSAAAITNITRSLKRVAQVFGIPVVISTQTLYSKMRGQSIKASSIGYSSSFGQDSDTVIAVEPRDDADGGPVEHWLKVLLSRSGPLIETQIDFDWSCSQFSEFANINLEDDPDEDDAGEMRVGVRNAEARSG